MSTDLNDLLPQNTSAIIQQAELRGKDRPVAPIDSLQLHVGAANESSKQAALCFFQSSLKPALHDPVIELHQVLTASPASLNGF